MSKWTKRPDEPEQPCQNPECKNTAARNRQHPHLSRKYCSNGCGERAWHSRFTAEHGASYWQHVNGAATLKEMSK